jgi:tetratricopeptide (TPR) repeat protein
MALEGAGGFVAAQPYLARMRRHAAGTSDREQLTFAAVDAWSRGNIRNALHAYREIAARNPGDIAAAKWGQYHAFNLGDAVTLRALAEAVMPAHEQTAEAHGMLAFGEEQCHRLKEAEDAAMRAIALKASDPWAHHALAHIYESQDRTNDAIRFLSARSAGWADRSIFIREHNWWHLALFHLDRGEQAKALEIFDRHLWGTWPEFAQEQLGAISALWRLELAGSDAGARWQPLADKVAERGFEHILPFHDIHFAFALARSGDPRAADQFLRSLAAHAIASEDLVWPEVALPAAQAVAAFAEGDMLRAAMQLEPLLSQLHRLGGSHSQRDVLIQTWIEAALSCGEARAIDDVLARRVRSRAQLGSLRRFLRQARRRSHPTIATRRAA